MSRILDLTDPATQNAGPDVVTGNITALNANLASGTPTAGSFVAINAADADTLGLQITGTWVGTLIVQGSLDGANWINLTNWSNINGGALWSTTTANGLWQFDAAGINYVRVTCSAYTSGTAVITLSPTDKTGIVGIDNPVSIAGTATVDTELPAAAALADATTNPTSPLAGAAQEAFNGATWDRFRNNVNTTTGDTGAKTATFGGATQTNYNARGAIITFVIGTVTGTSPTMAPQLQYSDDGGTTWTNFGPALANITASGTHVLMVYPSNISQAAGVTPANLTTGGTQTVAINAPLPRTWRINYTIGGTTPSFTITRVGVNYIL